MDGDVTALENQQQAILVIDFILKQVFAFASNKNFSACNEIDKVEVIVIQQNNDPLFIALHPHNLFLKTHRSYDFTRVFKF